MPISRRGAVFGVAGAAILGALSACGVDTSQPSGPPRPGGVVRGAFEGGGASETLDPHAPRPWVDQARHKALFDKLTELDNDMSPVPRLAASWQSNADASVWRFTLRDAVFHDGRPVTPADVLASYARVLDPRAAGRRGSQLLGELDLANSRAIDPHTVELRLHNPVIELPARLAGTGMAIIPAGTRDFSSPIGSGPFRFVSFDRGRSMIARCFERHWGGAPYVEQLEVLSAGLTARGNALLGGQVHYSDDMDPTFARLHSADDTVRIVRAQGSGMQAFAAKVDRPPFNDPRVLRALALTIDRQQLVDVVLAGMGELGNDLFGRGYRYYPSDLPQREHDPQGAKALLREAGVENLAVTLATADAAPGFVQAATLLAEQAKAAGITVKVVTTSKDTYYADILSIDALVNETVGAMPIPNYIATHLLSSVAQNVTHFRSPSFDGAYGRAQATQDEAARTAIYHEMQRQFRDTGGLLVWGHSDWLGATASRLSGVVAAPQNTLNWARFDKVWLDSDR
ncbi:MAG TPA: ABC transporter substrate-binding protein [Pseudonocardia sp.]|nr:ABC transporter substrate-binding protein [Pseudonocardia sp.]